MEKGNDKMTTDEPPQHASLAAALAAVQLDLPQVVKDNRVNAGPMKYSYANLADTMRDILPRCAKHGLAWVTMPTIDDSGRLLLHYKLMHVSGESIEGDYPLPANANAQQLGSAITYGRRYTFMSVIGVAPDDDDDGAAASTAGPPTRVNRPVRQAPTISVVAETEAAEAQYPGFLDELAKQWKQNPGWGKRAAVPRAQEATVRAAIDDLLARYEAEAEVGDE